MKQIILVSCYCGCSDYVFEMTVQGGKLLTTDEVKRIGLVSDIEMKNYRQSSYVYQWYEVQTGDVIVVEKQEADDTQRFTLKVPEANLPEPPNKLDDTIGNKHLEYLLEHYSRIQ